MYTEQLQDMYTDVLVIHKERIKKMQRDMVEILKEARKKKIFNTGEFRQILEEIKCINKKIIVDWDDGAGEEWATVTLKELGIIGMIHSKIGIMFWIDIEEIEITEKLLANIHVVNIEGFDTDGWFIIGENIEQVVPELNWSAPESAMDCDNFCLRDFYVMTV